MHMMISCPLQVAIRLYEPQQLVRLRRLIHHPNQLLVMALSPLSCRLRDSRKPNLR